LGISSAVALFQRLIGELLGEEFLAGAVKVYLESILIFNKTFEDHQEHEEDRKLDKLMDLLPENMENPKNMRPIPDCY